MQWDHKGISFAITFQEMGALVMASARAPKDGEFVRVRAFSAIGTSQDEALARLKDQIKLKYRKIPEVTQ